MSNRSLIYLNTMMLTTYHCVLSIFSLLELPVLYQKMNTSKMDPIMLGLSTPIIMSVENINFCVGLPLNIGVIIFLTRDGGLDRSLILTLNQVACEILFAILAPLFVLCYVNVKNLCIYYPIAFFTGTCMTSRFLFQCCVCFERYMAVVHPVTFLKYKAIKYRLTISVMIWTYAFIAGIVSMFKLSELPLKLFVILYTMILSMMLFCSFSLLRGLRRPGPGAKGRDDGGVSSAREKAFKVVCLNLLIFLIQTIPVMVCFGIYFTLSYDAFTLAFIVGINIAILTSLLQPVLFLYQNGKLTCMKRS